MSNAGLAAEGLGLSCHDRASARTGKRCFTDFYTRMRADRPAPTITTNCNRFGNGRFEHHDMSQDRSIPLRKATALQSFPNDYVFLPPGKITQTARMIGNAVPPSSRGFLRGILLDYYTDYERTTRWPFKNDSILTFKKDSIASSS
jgi:DNA (cytosine-5)-methyltransferase 1